MTTKEGFFEKQARQQLEAQYACWEKHVNDDTFEPTTDARAAFLAGWEGVRDFERAKRRMYEAGGNANVLSMILFTFGLIIASFAAFALWGLPRDNLNATNTAWMLVVGVLMAIGSIVTFRVSRKQALAGRREFSLSWEPSSKETPIETKLTIDR